MKKIILWLLLIITSITFTKEVDEAATRQAILNTANTMFGMRYPDVITKPKSGEIDCSHFAFRSLQGGGLNGVSGKGYLSTAGMRSSGMTKNLSISQLKPGDFIVTSPRPGGEYGHVMIVRQVLPNGKVEIIDSSKGADGVKIRVISYPPKNYAGVISVTDMIIKNGGTPVNKDGSVIVPPEGSSMTNAGGCEVGGGNNVVSGDGSGTGGNAVYQEIKGLIGSGDGYGNYKAALDRVASMMGLDPMFLAVVADRESGFRRNLKASCKSGKCSATGLFQHTDDNWVYLKRRWGGKYGLGSAQPSNDESRKDPAQSMLLMGEYFKEQASILQKKGLEPNFVNLYFTHFFGQTGGPKLLNADKNADACKVVMSIFPKNGSDVIANHGTQIRNKDGSCKSVGEFLSNVAKDLADKAKNLDPNYVMADVGSVGDCKIIDRIKWDQLVFNWDGLLDKLRAMWFEPFTRDTSIYKMLSSILAPLLTLGLVLKIIMNRRESIIDIAYESVSYVLFALALMYIFNNWIDLIYLPMEDFFFRDMPNAILKDTIATKDGGETFGINAFWEKAMYIPKFYMDIIVSSNFSFLSPLNQLARFLGNVLEGIKCRWDSIVDLEFGKTCSAIVKTFFEFVTDWFKVILLVLAMLQAFLTLFYIIINLFIAVINFMIMVSLTGIFVIANFIPSTRDMWGTNPISTVISAGLKYIILITFFDMIFKEYLGFATFSTVPTFDSVTAVEIMGYYLVNLFIMLLTHFFVKESLSKI